MSHAQANRLMILAAALWGLGNVAQQTVLEHIGPFMAVGLRCLIAALVMLPFLRPKPCLAAIARNSDKTLALYTILAFVAALTFGQAGYGLTSVTNGGFIVNTTTVVTPILAWALLSQTPHGVVWLSAIVILTGAALMSGGSLQGFNLGDALCLCSAVCYGFWMIFLGEFAQRCDDTVTLTFLQFCCTGLICLTLGWGLESATLSNIISAIPELLLLGIFSTAGAYLLQSIAQKHTSASEAAVIGSGEAVVGAALAYLILGENLTRLSAVGAAMVFAGIVLVQWPALAADLQLRRKTMRDGRLVAKLQPPIRVVAKPQHTQAYQADLLPPETIASTRHMNRGRVQ